jgi:hypothetical protein
MINSDAENRARNQARPGPGNGRYAVACTYLAVYLIAEISYVQLTPSARASLTAWATTSVSNLEHEPIGPLVVSAFIGPGHSLVWPVLIAVAMFGANRALGNARTAAICAAGHVIGTLVSEGIIAYRVDAGQLPVADRALTDVGPSYVVVSAIVIAVACGTWPARVAAALDFAMLVFGGNIFGGLSHADVSAVGHLTALLTAAACVALSARPPRGRRSAEVTDEGADQVGDPGRARAEHQLTQRPPPERPGGQPGHHPAA